jgi:hypothetical protein
MQGGERVEAELAHAGEMQVINVEVQHVELGGEVDHVLHHGDVVRHGVVAPRIEPQPARRHGVQPRRGHGIGGGEQGDVLAHVHQRLGKVRHHPLGTAIELRRHALVQRRDHGNPHIYSGHCEAPGGS